MSVHRRSGPTARRFKPYPQYKVSGVEWLGEIPSAWSVRRLKHLVKFQGGGTPAKESLEYWSGDIPWVSPKDMKERTIYDTIDKITAEAVTQSATRLVDRGAVLLVVRSGILNHSIPVAIAGRQVTLNQDLKALIPRREISSEYLSYFIDGMQGPLLVEWRKEGATVESLELELIANTRVPVPPAECQRAIAAFLDLETAKIDALMAKKERAIELLQEKRSALITQAVTEGLDPSVPMKDSRVESLGEIPAHWEIKRLPQVVHIQEGPGIMASDFTDEGVPLLRIANLTGGAVRLDGCDYLAPEAVTRKWSHFKVHSGDLLISGSASIGLASVVDSAAAGAVPYTGIFCLRPVNEDVARDFVRYFVTSNAFLDQVNTLKTGVGVQHYGPTHLRRVYTPSPPLTEQQRIARFLDRETVKIDALERRVRNGIDRINEFRAALISAAVTGKIDVREAN